MRIFRGSVLALVVALLTSLVLVAPAGAATGTLGAPARGAAVPRAPFPSCGDHFQFTRSGSNVRIVGVGLNAFSSG
jgi:hypothetical protein